MHQLHPFLDREVLMTIAHALVISKLDYCNTSYMVPSWRSIGKLQLIQIVAAQVVKDFGGLAHVNPLLWGHIGCLKFRMWFKALVATFKNFHDLETLEIVFSQLFLLIQSDPEE